jgi:hypothetical protein
MNTSENLAERKANCGMRLEAILLAPKFEGGFPALHDLFDGFTNVRHINRAGAADRAPRPGVCWVAVLRRSRQFPMQRL